VGGGGASNGAGGFGTLSPKEQQGRGFPFEVREGQM
jgi:hypothetical protein